MSETIKDGTGAGYLARVTPEHRLMVTSTSVAKIVEYTESGNGFNFSIIDVPVSGGVDTNLLYIKNTDPDAYLYIQQLIIGYDGGASTGAKTGILYAKVGTGVPTSAAVASTPSNLLVGSTHAAITTFYTWDKTTAGGMVVPVSGTKTLGLQIAAGTTYHRLDGSFILMPGAERCYSFKATETGTFSLTLHTFYAVPGE